MTYRVPSCPWQLFYCRFLAHEVMCNNMNNVFSKHDSLFPGLLAEIPDCPSKLYFKGEWDTNLFDRCCSVVGSRKMTTYGKRITDELVGEIASAGITIVSGFMYGIDAAAHAAALKAGGKTIAVMPCGIDIVHPAYQEQLYNEILASGGLIISEWPDNFPPAKWTYPQRNRIVAGLSKASVVVEAGLSSGSLITARLAKKYGREIFAVPGPITSNVSLGSLELIQNGAHMVRAASDVLSFYGQSSTLTTTVNYSHLQGREEIIVKNLLRQPMHIDELARTIGMSSSEIGSSVSILEMRGIISQQNGSYYVS
jgi:DNA processing protein